ncbi:hypothetical protein C7B61_09700 [filamentous cyanobacterium CCP1]|nr:hypothetical protein C7B76_02010 [filamentous cyanobacterium CCP2]PSB66763.1 hypothetical protein C7B61_09700 [filamentous cyanobacterium CCP1]
MFAAIAETEEDAPVLVQPESAGRRGAKPELIRLLSSRHEMEYLIERVQQFHEQRTAWKDMAIVYRDRGIGEQIAKQLKAAQLPVEWINETNESRNYHPAEDSIKLVTMHSSKGLEFPVVFVAGVGLMPHPHVPIQEDARLLYVAMTRAIDRLVMTCDRPSRFVKRLEVALEQVA